MDSQQIIYRIINGRDENRRLDRRYVILGMFIFTVVATISFLATRHMQSASAADLSKFNPGNIISDEVMRNKGSMTEQEIQTFLKSKNKCNDTNIEKAKKYSSLKYNIKDGHFVCMADDTFLNNETNKQETAAHIIWQAAQDFNINPQVLIVLLEKEQSLVTDTWPNHIQYRSATGYGCPDTAACDSKYYGFWNQVRNAAKLFDTVLSGGWTNYPLGKNYIQYNPSKSCGGSYVTIENLATSALYRYTPYQPNAAALKAYTGTATCGAYGNRNFFIYFSDWFGSTTELPKKQDQQPAQQNQQQNQQQQTQPAQQPAQQNQQAQQSQQTQQPAQQNQQQNQQQQTQPAQQPAQQTQQPQVPAAVTNLLKSKASLLGNKKGNLVDFSADKSLKVMQCDKGVIVGNDKIGYFAIKQKAYDKWAKNYKTLGVPTANWANNSATKIEWQSFKNGLVVGNDSKGWFLSMGNSRKVWQRNGFEGGVLGFPTSDFNKNNSTGMEWQVYEHGYILGNDKKGWYISYGGARSVWARKGYEMGVLGWPKSDVSCNKKTGMCWQEFEKGYALGNDKKGWYESRGSIRKKWAKAGYESGRYGWPKSDIKNGRQQYTKGTIYQ